MYLEFHMLESNRILTIFPFPSSRIDEAIQFICCDSLGVDVHPDGFELHVGICLIQGPQDLALASSSIANDKDGVPHMPQLFKLHYLKNKVVLSLQSKILYYAYRCACMYQ